MAATLQDFLKSNNNEVGNVLTILQRAEKDYGRTGEGITKYVARDGIDSSVWAWYDAQTKGKTPEAVASDIAAKNAASSAETERKIASGELTKDGLTPAEVAQNKVADAAYADRAAKMVGGAPAPTAVVDPANPERRVNIFNPSTGQTGYQSEGAPIPPGWVAQGAPGSTPATPGSSSPGAGASVPGAGAQATVTPPLTALQPGATGDEVKKLQDYLVSQGLMTQEQVNTGYGIYGPQTTAAVSALQQKLGVDNSSGPGFFGPKTLAALQTSSAPGGAAPGGATPSTATKTGTATPGSSGNSTLLSLLAGSGINAPQGSSITDIITELSKAYGIDDITNTMKGIDDQYVKDVANINDDPWISEGLRVKKVQKLKDSYDLKRKAYVDELALKKDVIGQAITLYNAEQTNQRQALESALSHQVDLLKIQTPDTQVVQLDSGADVLIDKKTGQVIKTIGTGSGSGSSDGSSGTGGKAPAPKLSSTQLNTGSSRLGVTTAAFKNLDGQVQTWALSTGGKNFIDAIQKMKGQQAKYDDILASINASVQPPAVKDYMTKTLDANAPANPKKTGVGAAASGFWNTLVNFVQ